MDPKAAEHIFWEATQLASHEERQRYLDEACAGNAILRRKVEMLLAVQSQAVDFLETPVAAPTADQAPLERPGTLIGPYKLLQEIGQGGMGVVYMAEQYEPVRRKVALKIIKPGMDTQQVIARFEAERQALSLMDHPNIARVLDAGATGNGRPYFAMELVKGQPITQYCDERRLSPRQRLELLLPVCQAIQHAHQKGIIHRDIKPSNILIAEFDEHPVPKVIDFGVAKAISQPLTDKTMFTGYGQIVGTLEYMSPEQAKVNQLDVDTRTDIYSLGVLLYELLTGTTPLDKQQLRSAGWDEMLRMIREVEPARPSTRLAESKDSLASISAQRRMEPVVLTRLVRGELDWIVMKALDKDRSRRYDSASSLASDIQRFLNNESVAAYPPSAAYRFRKFARRNKAAMVTAMVVTAALVLGLVGISWQAIRATMAEQQARDNERLAREHAVAEANQRQRAELAARAERQAREAEARQRRAAEIAEEKAVEGQTVAHAVVEFLTNDLLGQSSPLEQADPEIKLKDVVERAIQRVDGRFPDQPLVEAAVLSVLAKVVNSKGNAELAEQQLRRALELRQRELGPEHRDTLVTRNYLAVLARVLGRLDDAAQLHRETLEIQQRTLGPEHPDTLISRRNLGLVLLDQGQLVEAEAQFRAVLERQQDTVGADDPEALHTRVDLGNALYRRGQFELAEECFRETLAAWQRLRGPEHPFALTSQHNLATAMAAQEKTAAAEPMLRQTLASRRKVLGNDHPATVESMNGLAVVLKTRQRYPQAESLYVEALEVLRRTRGRDHPSTLDVMFNLGLLYAIQNKLSEAETLFRETFDRERERLGPEHARTRQTQSKLVAVYRSLHWELVAAADPARRDAARAVQIAAHALELLPKDAEFHAQFGAALYSSGELFAALQAFHEADKLSERPDPRYGYWRAMTAWKLNETDEARRYYAATAAWWKSKETPPAIGRLRSEAEALLRIDDESQAAQQPTIAEPDGEKTPTRMP